MKEIKKSTGKRR